MQSESTTDDLKTCVKCHEAKPRAAFGLDKRRSDGLFPYCKRCRLKNPEEAEERDRNRASGLHRCTDCRIWKEHGSFYPNPHNANGLHYQCQPCSIIRANNYAVRNPERIRSRSLLHRQSNREQLLARYRRWYAANREAAMAAAIARSRTPEGRMQQARANHLRRARVADTLITLTLQEWLDILASQEHRCGMCSRDFGPSLKPTMDHMVPVKCGGGLTRENVGALCKPCNSRKKDRTVIYR